LQETFKETHKALEKSRLSALNPQELEQAIETLEQERTQLINKLGKLKERVSAPEYVAAKFDDILKITHLLRREQEEEQKCSELLKEQTFKLQGKMNQFAQEQNRLRELEAADAKRQVSCPVLPLCSALCGVVCGGADPRPSLSPCGVVIRTPPRLLRSCAMR
jgi:hypothetical protein